MPRLGIDESSPASAKLIPRSASSAGIRNAMPLMKAVAHNVAASEIASRDQRRVALIDAVGTSPWLQASACGGQRVVAAIAAVAAGRGEAASDETTPRPLADFLAEPRRAWQ